MVMSVECRAIATAPSFPDIVLTTAHLPGELISGLHVHLAEWLGVKRSTAILYDDFRNLQKHGPAPFGSNSRYDAPGGGRTWLTDPQAFCQAIASPPTLWSVVALYE